MSHPKSLKLFRAWAKAMEQGAVVGNPDYTKTTRSGAKKARPKRRARRPRRKHFLRKRKMED